MQSDQIGTAAQPRPMSTASEKRKRKSTPESNADPGGGSQSSEVDVTRLTKRQCQERLKQMQNDLLCPICRSCSYCPVRFPCGKHYGCHACMVQLVSRHCRVRYDDTDDKFHLGSVLRCLYCGDASRSTYCHVASNSELEPAPHIVINALYGDQQKYKCPYCDCTDTMTALCKHVQLSCTSVCLTCPICKEQVGFNAEALTAHMREKCNAIPCPYQACRFQGRYTDLIEHCKPHRKVASLRSMMRYLNETLLSHPRFVMPKTAPGAGVMTPAHQDRFTKAIDTFKQSLLSGCSELINIVAESNSVPPLVLMQRCGADRLCDAFNEDTNALLTFEADSSEEEDDDEDES